MGLLAVRGARVSQGTHGDHVAEVIAAPDGVLTVMVAGRVCEHGDLTGPASPGWLCGKGVLAGPGGRGLRRALRLYVVINRLLPGPEGWVPTARNRAWCKDAAGLPMVLDELELTPIRARPAAGGLWPTRVACVRARPVAV